MLIRGPRCAWLAWFGLVWFGLACAMESPPPALKSPEAVRMVRKLASMANGARSCASHPSPGLPCQRCQLTACGKKDSNQFIIHAG
eukprot:gene12985-biopygen15543